MISLTNYDFQWARSELVIIYPDFFQVPGVTSEARKPPSSVWSIRKRFRSFRTWQNALDTRPGKRQQFAIEIVISWDFL